MSIDVQMFVLCDHIVNSGGLDDPKEKPILSLEENEYSTLNPGTYYVANSYINKHYGETLISPVSKLYVEEGQSLIIKINDYYNQNDVVTNNVYVNYTPENLTLTDLTPMQLEKEKEIIENLYFQDNVVSGVFELTELSTVVDYLAPKKNTTKVANYVGRESMCPKCYGKGYYYDIFFDKSGVAVTATKSQKLYQECLKVLIDEKLGNKYHPEWGCDVEQRIGTKNKGSIDVFKVELSVREAIERLRMLQINNQIQYMNMHDEEIIESIQSIEVRREGYTGYNVNVVVKSVVGNLITYNVRL